MAELKTKPTRLNVEAFLNTIEDEGKRSDCIALAALMEKVTGQAPARWGTSIVGFGSYHYKYASGHEGDAPVLSFSPRKQNISIYGTNCMERDVRFLRKLGKHKTGKGCLYINKLSDVNLSVLEELCMAGIKNQSR